MASPLRILAAPLCDDCIIITDAGGCIFFLVLFLRSNHRQAKPLLYASAEAARRWCDWHFFLLSQWSACACFQWQKTFSIRLLHEMQLNYLHASIILFIVCRRTLAHTHSPGQPSENSFAAADGTLRVSGLPPPLLEWNARSLCAARQKRPWALRLLNRTAINGLLLIWPVLCVFV